MKSFGNGSAFNGSELRLRCLKLFELTYGL